MLQAKPISVVTVLFLLAASLAVASGCGAAAGVGAVTSNIVGGFAVKGPIIDGTVFAYVQNSDGSKGALLSEGTTDERGAFELSLEDYSGCVRLEVVSGTYKDEATGRIVDLATEGIVLLGLVPDYDAETGLTNISITPLTSIAASLAIETLEEGGGDPAVAAATANAQVASYFGLDDIINTPPPDLTDEDDPYDGEMDDAAAAAVIIAGLSELAADSGVSAMELIGALAEDYSDGVFDGAADGETVGLGGTDLSADMTTTELASGIEDFVEGENNTSVVDTSDVDEIRDTMSTGGGAPPPIPSISHIDPIEGDIDGGTVVTIWGENLDLVETVRFGGNKADFDVFSDIYLEVKSFNGVGNYYIEAIAPAGDDDGTVTVSVRGSGGIGDSLANAFTYISVRQAVVSSVTPPEGPEAGGETVTISGQYFEPDALVYFGAAAATGVVVASPTQLTCTVPAGAEGFADVIVANPGVAQGSLTGGYEYLFTGIRLSDKAWGDDSEFQTAVDGIAFSPAGEEVHRQFYYYDSEGNGVLLFTTTKTSPSEAGNYVPTIYYDAEGYGHMAYYDDDYYLWYAWNGEDKEWDTEDDTINLIDDDTEYEYEMPASIAVDSEGKAAIVYFDYDYEYYYVWYDVEGDRKFDEGIDEKIYLTDYTYDYYMGSAVFTHDDHLAFLWPDYYDGDIYLWVDTNDDFYMDEGDPNEVSGLLPDSAYESYYCDLAIDPDGNLGAVISYYMNDDSLYDVYYWYDSNGDYIFDEGEYVAIAGDMNDIQEVTLTFDTATAGYPPIVGFLFDAEAMLPAKSFEPPGEYTAYSQWTDADGDLVVDEGELTDPVGVQPDGVYGCSYCLDFVWAEIDGSTVLCAAYTIYDNSDYEDKTFIMYDGAGTGTVDGVLDPETELVEVDNKFLDEDEGIAFAVDADGRLHLMTNIYYDDSWYEDFGIMMFDENKDGTLTLENTYGAPASHRLYASYYDAGEGAFTDPTRIESGTGLAAYDQPIVMFEGDTGDAIIVWGSRTYFDVSGLVAKSYYNSPSTYDEYGLSALYTAKYHADTEEFDTEGTMISADLQEVICYGFVSDGLDGFAQFEAEAQPDYYPYSGTDDTYLTASYNGYWTEKKKACEFDEFLGVVALVEDHEYQESRVYGWAYDTVSGEFGAAQHVARPADAGSGIGFNNQMIRCYNGTFMWPVYKDAIAGNCWYYGTFDGTDFSANATRVYDDTNGAQDNGFYTWMYGPDEGLEAVYFMYSQRHYDSGSDDWIDSVYLVAIDEETGTLSMGLVDSGKGAEALDFRPSKDGDYVAILYSNESPGGYKSLYARVFNTGTDLADSSNFVPDPDVENLLVSTGLDEYVYLAQFQLNTQSDNSIFNFWIREDQYTDTGLFNRLVYDGTDLSTAFDAESAPMFAYDMAYGNYGYWRWYWDKARIAEDYREFGTFEYDNRADAAQVFDDGNGGAVIYTTEYRGEPGLYELFATVYRSGEADIEAPVKLSGDDDVKGFFIRALDTADATTHHVLWLEENQVNYRERFFHREFDFGATTFDGTAFSPDAALPATMIDVLADTSYDTVPVSVICDDEENLLVVYHNGNHLDTGGGRETKGSETAGEQLYGVVYSRACVDGLWAAEEVISIDNVDWNTANHGYVTYNDHTTANLFAGSRGAMQAIMLIVSPNPGYYYLDKQEAVSGYLPCFKRLFIKTRD